MICGVEIYLCKFVFFTSLKKGVSGYDKLYKD